MFFRLVPSFTFVSLAAGLLTSLLAHADDANLRRFNSCIKNLADTPSQKELARVIDDICIPDVSPLSKSQKSITQTSLQVIQSKNWPQTITKIAAVYDRFLIERVAALKRTDEQLRLLERQTDLNPEKTSKDLSEKLESLNQICEDLGALNRKQGFDPEFKQMTTKLAAEALKNMLENYRFFKLFMSTQTMRDLGTNLHDGTLGIQHCADGRPLFTRYNPYAQELVSPMSLRLMKNQLREKWRVENEKVFAEKNRIETYKSILKDEATGAFAGAPATGALRWTESIYQTLGTDIADYPEAIAVILSDPSSNDPAVANILCSSVSAANLQSSQMAVAGTVGAIGLGLFTAGVGATVGMTATGITFAEAGLGTVYSMLAIELGQAESLDRLSGPEMLGLITHESMKGIVSDEVADGCDALANDLAFFGVGKGLGKVLRRLNTKGIADVFRSYAKKAHLSDEAIAEKYRKLKNSLANENGNHPQVRAVAKDVSKGSAEEAAKQVTQQTLRAGRREIVRTAGHTASDKNKQRRTSPEPTPTAVPNTQLLPASARSHP